MTNPQKMPKPAPEVFGRFAGQDVHRITLCAETGLSAHVLTWGAVLQDLQMPLQDGRSISLTLGFETFAPYPTHSPYFGAVVGRYANRIADGRFKLDGRIIDLDRNETGRTTLHGGMGGFSQRLWQIIDWAPASVTLGFTSADGDQGFPGRVEAMCCYALGPGNQMSITYRGVCDAATPLNLTQHSYFNLDGSQDLQHHLLLIHSNRYTPLDAAKIPTGNIESLIGTRFDFRHSTTVMTAGRTVDHNFVLAEAGVGELRPAAELTSVLSGIRMKIATTKPGLQVYDGHKLNVVPAGLAGRRYGPFAGLCLEPQFFPNSPNIPSFPNSILRPGELYHQTTVYSFDHMSDQLT